MATIFMIDGMEHGRVTTSAGGVYDASSGSPASVSSPVRTGIRALEVTPAGVAEYLGYTPTAGSRVVTASIYIRFAALPTADAQLLHFVSTVNCYLWFLNASDQFGVSVTTTGAVAGGPTLAIDTWYRVTVETDTTTNTFVIRAIVDGGTEFSDSAASTAADITSCRMGNSSAETHTQYYDDFLMSITDGDYEDISTWVGHSIEALIPNADGTHNITTAGDFDDGATGSNAFSNSTTNGNTFIAHRPLQAANTDGSIIRQELGTTANYMEFTLENLSASSDTVQDVRGYGTHIEAAASGASLGEARLLLSDNTEVLTTGSLSVINSTEDPGTTVNIRKRMTIAPSGGWDRTKVDGLKARVGFGDNAPDVNFIDFMVEVLLKPAAAGVTNSFQTVGGRGMMQAIYPTASG